VKVALHSGEKELEENVLLILQMKNTGEETNKEIPRMMTVIVQNDRDKKRCIQYDQGITKDKFLCENK